MYKEQIVTRHDRSDQNWNTYLEYETERKPRLNNTIAFDEGLDRRPNEVHSQYPIRLSLSKPLQVRD
jgi:hypothetical protein